MLAWGAKIPPGAADGSAGERTPAAGAPGTQLGTTSTQPRIACPACLLERGLILGVLGCWQSHRVISAGPSAN